MIKAVLFDMDGVIFDTERVSAKYWKTAGSRMNFKISDDQITLLRGANENRIRALAADWGYDPAQFFRVRNLKFEFMKDQFRQEGIPVKTGVRELFAYLRAVQLRKALVTSTERDLAVQDFSWSDLPFDFDATVCGTEIRNGKPAPDAYLTAAEKLSLLPEECIVVEDSPNGVRAGFRAGCHVIMVPDMDPPTEELQRCCHCICRDLLEVINEIQAMLA